MEKITQTLCTYMRNEGFAEEGNSLVKIVFADKRKKLLEHRKVTMRPVSIRGELMYQAEFHYDKKVTHQNIPFFEGVDFAEDLIRNDFKQVNILTEQEDIQILASKPDRPRITVRPASHKATGLEHDAKKNYIIPDGKPCDFLIELGVMGFDGVVFHKSYAKFRQINRFLEIVDNCFDELPSEGTIRVIDFGCGKSYLTFALYYYLVLEKGRDVEIIGLDLKEDVIRFCNKTARKLGYDGLKFLVGDIAEYDAGARGASGAAADMVVTLHACDTATDYALINAVRWGSRVILSVPCCQHELFRQIHEPVNDPMLKHGILKDKFTEILTDALRGLKLEAAGYDVDMIEFTSLEHTSKNVMIRAVRGAGAGASAAGGSAKASDAGATKGTNAAKAAKEYEALKEFYGVNPTIDEL